MINKNELRVGNLFADLTGNVHTVKGIHEDCIVTRYFGGFSSDFSIGGLLDSNEIWPTKSISIEDAQPIPLNVAWLLEMGFGGYAIWKKGYFELEYGHFSKCFQFRVGEWLNDIAHLHQLQNLYFSLTGEELTIKEPA